MKRMAGTWVTGVLAQAALVLAGCVGGDARVEMAAADSMDALAAQLELALDEYHADLTHADGERQADVVAALIGRLKADCGEDEKSAQHGVDFQGAMERLRADREVALERRGIAAENLTILRETATGLRRVGVASLSLEDETKRYLMDLMASRKAAASKTDVKHVVTTKRTQRE